MSFVAPSDNSLTANGIEALQRLGNHAASASELGAAGCTMTRLREIGVVSVDREGLPPLYSLTDLGRQALALLTADPQPVDSEQPVERIKRIVAETFRIPLIEMVSQRRSRKVARPRQIAMYLARETTPMSLPNIGRRFGGRDHTTVIHACKTIEGLVEIDVDTRLTVKSLLAKLGVDEDPTDEERIKDAIQGSAKLRDAILTANPQTWSVDNARSTFVPAVAQGRIAA
jgi:hypothetical protein